MPNRWHTARNKGTRPTRSKTFIRSSSKVKQNFDFDSCCKDSHKDVDPYSLRGPLVSNSDAPMFLACFFFLFFFVVPIGRLPTSSSPEQAIQEMSTYEGQMTRTSTKEARPQNVLAATSDDLPFT
mmetsp:Transcript_30626/g.98580  ORF Transcript_30626/g.98580 Transcript_30626/m.98580 type:complete len:125 (-) Transcript_30626:2169-2543(-)